MTPANTTFSKERDLVAAFCAAIPQRISEKWTCYHETAGFDLLLAHASGVQCGVEAKLTLNPKVLDQALPSDFAIEGPDYRAVLVPASKCQHHMTRIARAIGVQVIAFDARWFRDEWLPDPNRSFLIDRWPNWCPERRCTLPDYVPDVIGGDSAPVQLSIWKIKAIKLLIVLERTGLVTRGDLRALKLSPTRWTDHYGGFLSPRPDLGGYVRNARTPDLKAQHPTNWAQIEADFETWSKALPARQLGLVA